MKWEVTIEWEVTWVWRWIQSEESERGFSPVAWQRLACCPAFCTISTFILKNTPSSPPVLKANLNSTNKPIIVSALLKTWGASGAAGTLADPLANLRIGDSHLPVNLSLWGARVWIQGLKYVMQVLCHCAIIPAFTYQTAKKTDTCPFLS